MVNTALDWMADHHTPTHTLYQGGIFPGIWGYNLPRNIGGSHEIVKQIHAFVVAFWALQEIHYFLTVNPFLQWKLCTSDRKGTSFYMKCVPMLIKILPATVNFFLWQEIPSCHVKFLPIFWYFFLWANISSCDRKILLVTLDIFLWQ